MTLLYRQKRCFIHNFMVNPHGDDVTELECDLEAGDSTLCSVNDGPITDDHSVKAQLMARIYAWVQNSH